MFLVGLFLGRIWRPLPLCFYFSAAAAAVYNPSCSADIWSTTCSNLAFSDQAGLKSSRGFESDLAAAELHLQKLKRDTQKKNSVECVQPSYLHEIYRGRQHKSCGNSFFLLCLPPHYFKPLVVSLSLTSIFLSRVAMLLLLHTYIEQAVCFLDQHIHTHSYMTTFEGVLASISVHLCSRTRAPTKLFLKP